jgi:muramoyltetrapeptide carboxypeptidase
MNWTKPRALQSGDLVGVCAPGGPVEPAVLERGCQTLRELGFEVRVAPGTLARTRFTAGDAGVRRTDLEALFADDAVKGIVCARGGAGALGILRGLNADLLRSHPKAFVGYSDITMLHLLLNQLGLVTLQGPMVACELATGAFDRPSFLAGLTGQGAPFVADPGDLLPLRAGAAEGVLRGGCLSLLAAACGTPWAFSTGGEDTLLFLEDWDEAPYRVDRLLSQLRETGAFDNVRGVVFGDMKGCSPSVNDDYGLEEVLLSALDGLDLPIALGLSSGHTPSPQITLPFGVRARLACAEAAEFQVLESAVS